MKTKKISSVLCTCFSVLFALVFGAVALLALFTRQRVPEEYFFAVRPSRLLLLCAAWAAVLAGAAWLYKRFSAWLSRFALPIAGVLLALFAAVCAVTGWWLMVEGKYDVFAVYEGAQNIASGGSLGAQADYYYIRPNNVFAAAALGAVFKVCAAFGAADGMPVLLVLNVLLLTASALCVFGVARLLHSGAFGVFALFIMLCSLPMYAYTAVFYTDVLAMPFAIGGVWAYLAALQKGGLRRTGLLCLCGLLLGLGTAFKLTVAIALVAIVLHAVLCFVRGGSGRECVRVLAAAGALVLLCNLAAGAVQRTLLPDAQRREHEPLPFTHWTMMGLAGDGRWNNADELLSAREKTQQARVQVGAAEIAARVKAHGVGGLAQLAVKKSLYSFGDGTYNVASMLDDGALRENALHEFVLYTSPHFMLLFYVCTAYHIVLLLCAALGALHRVLRRRAVADGWLLLRLCWFGLWLFLMLWESNARYLVHFLPVLFLCAAAAFSPLLQADKADGHENIERTNKAENKQEELR